MKSKSFLFSWFTRSFCLERRRLSRWLLRECHFLLFLALEPFKITESRLQILLLLNQVMLFDAFAKSFHFLFDEFLVGLEEGIHDHHVVHECRLGEILHIGMIQQVDERLHVHFLVQVFEI